MGVSAERGTEKKGNFTKKNLSGVYAERGSEKLVVSVPYTQAAKRVTLVQFII